MNIVMFWVLCFGQWQWAKTGTNCNTNSLKHHSPLGQQSMFGYGVESCRPV